MRKPTHTHTQSYDTVWTRRHIDTGTGTVEDQPWVPVGKKTTARADWGKNECRPSSSNVCNQEVTTPAFLILQDTVRFQPALPPIS